MNSNTIDKEFVNWVEPNGVNSQIQSITIDTNAAFELVRTIDTPLKNPSEFDLESGSETWISNVKISQGRKMQRVWKSVQPDPWNLDCNLIQKSSQTNLKDEGEPIHENSKDQYFPQATQENEPDGPLKSLKYQKLFKTPVFTLKKKQSEIESSGDSMSSSLPQQLVLGGQSSRLSFTEIPSNSCITRTKLDVSDLCNTDDLDSNALEKVNEPNYRTLSDENGNPLQLLGATHSQLAVEKSEQIRKWISPHETTTALNPFVGSQEAPMNLSTNLKNSDSKLQNPTMNTVLEKYEKITCTSSPDGQINEESIYKASKVSLQGSYENRPNFNAYMAKFFNCPDPKSQERSVTPLLHSARKMSNHFYSNQNSPKSPQKSERPDQALGLGSLGVQIPEQDIMSNFKDISFHYQSKDGNLDDLTPTGFSFNFEYPQGSVSKPFTQYSLGHVSSYFPGSMKKKVSSTIQTPEPVTVPVFMMDVQETAVNTKELDNQLLEGQEDKKVQKENTYNIETIKSPTPCRLASDLSMVPLIHSAATIGSMTPSQYDLVNGGFYSDNGNSLPSTGFSGSRRPRSVRNRPYSGDMSYDVEQKRLSLYEGGYQQRNDPPVVSKISIPKSEVTKSWIQNNQQNTSSFLNSNNFDRLGDASQNPSTDENNTFKTLSKTSKERVDDGPNSKTDRYRSPALRNGRFWIQRSISGRAKPCGIPGIPKVTISTMPNTQNAPCNKNSRNNLSSASSSKGSLPGSRTSSKNFIQDNIEKVKSFKALASSFKMPTEKKPPLPKSGPSKPENQEVKLGPKKIGKPKVKAQSSPPPLVTEKVKEVMEGTENKVAAASTETPKPKIKRKVKGQVVKTKKLEVVENKEVVSMPDPYYMQATPSEREIIDEVVKADLEAILVRDAEQRPPNPQSDPEFSSGSRSTTPAPKPAGTHWAHGMKTTSQARNQYEDSQFQIIQKPVRTNVPALNKKTVSVKNAAAAGTLGNKKTPKTTSTKPKAPKQ